jgi:hypothetical protein
VRQWIIQNDERPVAIGDREIARPDVCRRVRALVAVALLATYLPVRLASRIDPIVARHYSGASSPSSLLRVLDHFGRRSGFLKPLRSRPRWPQVARLMNLPAGG